MQFFIEFDFFHHFRPPLPSKFNLKLHPKSSINAKKSCIIFILTHFPPSPPQRMFLEIQKKAPRVWHVFIPLEHFLHLFDTTLIKLIFSFFRIFETLYL